MSVEKCPVCNGKGRVPNGFYNSIGVDRYCTSSTTPEICRSCNGSGYVDNGKILQYSEDGSSWLQFITVLDSKQELIDMIKKLEDRISQLENKCEGLRNLLNYKDKNDFL